MGAGVVLATLAAGAAQAATPELSIDKRLKDRREVAAGTRAQVLGFQDGRFYANGWHITGEMGGIVTPPLKLLDSVAFRVNDTWVAPATEFTSGAGYVRYAFPSVDGIELERTDVAPDGRRGALLGLELTNTKKNARTVNVFVDAHSELMTQYPWGFSGTVPNASDNAPDRGAFDGDRLVFRDTGSSPARRARHSYTALVGSDRGRVNADARPGLLRPVRAGPRVRRPTTAGDAVGVRRRAVRQGHGRPLHYRVAFPAAAPRRLWVAAAGSENSPAEAARRVRRLTGDPAALLSASAPARADGARGRSSTCRPTGSSPTRSSGASRTCATSPRWPRTSTCAGPTRARCGSRSAPWTACAGSARASPTTRGCSASTASTPRTRP